MEGGFLRGEFEVGFGCWYWSWTVWASRGFGGWDHWIGKLILVGLLGFWRWAR